jgi:DNA-binding MarR family transcriptional regulator
MASASNPVVELSALGLAVKRVQSRDHRAMDAALRPLGVSLVQWDALRAIDRTPGVSAHQLALATFQSDQAWGTLATRLVDRGLIIRSPGVGRRVVHELTSEGRALLADGTAVTERVLPGLFVGISPDEQAVLLGLLQKVLDAD